MDISIKVGTLITHTNKVCLIKEWSNNKKGYYWNFIKGTFDSNLDRNLLETAKRESIEEACADVSITNYINTVVKYGFSIRIYINLVGNLTKGKPHLPPRKEQLKNKEDIIEIKWFTKKEASSLTKDDFVNDVVYDAVKRWTHNEIYPLNLLTEKDLNN